MLKRYTRNIDFDLYRNAADKLDIAFVPVLEEAEPIGYFSIGGKRVYIERNKLGVNNSISNSIARNKNRTYRILEKRGIPCPRAIQVNRDNTIEDISGRLKTLQKPLVVKPVKGSLGKGVSVKLESARDVADAVRHARRISPTVLIEEYIAGNNYRANVFENEVIDILERIPAYVIGDGKSSIRALIDEKNAIRATMGLKKIKIDRELRRFVKDQKLSLASVPARGLEVPLRLSCNMASGGETKRVNMQRDVHPDNLRMFVAAARSLGLALAGIDFITPDLSRSYKEIRCVINEINRAPMLDAHYFADFAMNNIVAEKILARVAALVRP
jgi:cyanophycin synthetase